MNRETNKHEIARETLSRCSMRHALIASRGYQCRAKKTEGRSRVCEIACLREITLSPPERDVLFFLDAGDVVARLKLSALSTCRFYDRAAMPRNKDHMYTSVSRETLSLDSCYRWWLIIRARPRSLSSDPTRGKEKERGRQRGGKWEQKGEELQPSGGRLRHKLFIRVPFLFRRPRTRYPGSAGASIKLELVHQERSLIFLSFSLPRVVVVSRAFVVTFDDTRHRIENEPDIHDFWLEFPFINYSESYHANIQDVI